MRVLGPARGDAKASTTWSLATRLSCGGLILAALTGAFAQSPPGQYEREFQREPTPSFPAPAVVPPGADTVAPAGADKVRFILRSIRVEGATVYSEDALRTAFASLLGTEISLARLYEVAAALTRRYRDDGYVLSQVIVPAQSIRDGAVRLQAVEGYVASVRFEGDPLGPQDDLDAYTDKIRGSRPLRAADLERYLLLMNDLPGLTVRATLSPSAEAGAADLTLSVTRRRFVVSTGINNRGSKSLGPVQADIWLDGNSLLGAFDRGFLRVVRTVSNDELTFLSGAYEVFIGTEGLKVGLIGSRAKAKPGTGQNFNLPTNSGSVTAALAYPLLRSRIANVGIRGGLSFYDSETDFNDIELSQDRIRALRAGLSWDALDAWRGVNLVDLEISQGLNAFGASASGDPLASRSGGQPDFTKIALYAARLQSIAPRWSILAATNAQYGFDKLLTPEQYAFGGQVFGRAYDAAELLGDSGVALKLELRYNGYTASPILGEYMPYAFYEIGAVYRREPSLGEQQRESAADAGLGVRFSVGRTLDGYVEIAVPLTRPVAQEGSKAARVFAAIQLTF